MLISISTYSNELFSEWRSNYLYTYVLVKENTSRIQLQEKLKRFVSARLEPYYGDLLTAESDIHKVLKMHLFPIRDIHLDPSPNWELEIGGSISSVRTSSLIALLILAVACINFINLSTARANKRALEVGVRKTFGAIKSQLKVQFIDESVVLASISLQNWA